MRMRKKRMVDPPVQDTTRYQRECTEARFLELRFVAGVTMRRVTEGGRAVPPDRSPSLELPARPVTLRTLTKIQ